MYMFYSYNLKFPAKIVPTLLYLFFHLFTTPFCNKLINFLGFFKRFFERYRGSLTVE